MANRRPRIPPPPNPPAHIHVTRADGESTLFCALRSRGAVPGKRPPRHLPLPRALLCVKLLPPVLRRCGRERRAPPPSYLYKYSSSVRARRSRAAGFAKRA